MPANWNITARITSKAHKALELVNDLELDRGEAVIGQPFTKQEMEAYLQNHRRHVYCWTDGLAASKHMAADNQVSPMDEDYTGFEGEEWTKYRVCVGLQYGTTTDGEGSTHVVSKIIDHMVVDVSVGAEPAYRYCCAAINELALRWGGHKAGKLICRVNSKDSRWLTMFTIAGFTPCETVGDEIVMELIGGAA